MALDLFSDLFSNWTVTITNGSGGASAVNTVSLGIAYEGDLDQSAVDAIANIFRDSLTPLYDNSWILGPVHVRGGGDPGFVFDSAGTEAGTDSSTAYASPAIAHVCSKQTGIPGRKFRGRFYLPGVPEADVDESGTLAGSRVNDVNAALVTLQTDLLAVGPLADIVLFHDEESPGSHQPTSIANIVCRTVVGTMRPRQRR